MDRSASGICQGTRGLLVFERQMTAGVYDRWLKVCVLWPNCLCLTHSVLTEISELYNALNPITALSYFLGNFLYWNFVWLDMWGDIYPCLSSMCCKLLSIATCPLLASIICVGEWKCSIPFKKSNNILRFRCGCHRPSHGSSSENSRRSHTGHCRSADWRFVFVLFEIFVLT